MLYVFFDLPIITKGLAEAKLFESEDDLKRYLIDTNNINDLEIASVGYYNKSICNEEFREVWSIDSEPKMLGKVIQVKDTKKFNKSISKWAASIKDKDEEDYLKIKEVFSLG